MLFSSSQKSDTKVQKRYTDQQACYKVCGVGNKVQFGTSTYTTAYREERLASGNSCSAYGKGLIPIPIKFLNLSTSTNSVPRSLDHFLKNWTLGLLIGRYK